MVDFAWGVLLVSLYLLPLAALVYFIWAGLRTGPHFRGPKRYRRRSVVFHVVWAMGLSLPGFALAAVGGLGEDWRWIARLLGLALIGCWAIAITALANRRVPEPLAWVPIVVVVVSFTFYVAQAGDAFGAILLSGFGLGLGAWLLVSINVLTSITGFGDIQPPTRAFARYPREAAWHWPPSQLSATSSTP